MARAIGAFLVAALLGAGVGTSTAHAAVITFEATDLTDTTPGADLWRYTYRVSEFSPAALVAFETLFDPDSYRALEDLPPAVPGWDIVALQPDPLLPDDGRYSALALEDGASLAGLFTVTFVWLGGAGSTPGVQPFEIVAFDEVGVFLGTLAEGFTTPHQPGDVAVAVPATGLLLGAGTLAGAALTRRVGGRARGLANRA